MERGRGSISVHPLGTDMRFSLVKEELEQGVRGLYNQVV
jgi:hypothetical protein